MPPATWRIPVRGVGCMVSDEIRTTCYAFRVKLAAQHLGLPENSTADDVLKAVIAQQKDITMEKVRQVVMAALDREDHG